MHAMHKICIPLMFTVHIVLLLLLRAHASNGMSLLEMLRMPSMRPPPISEQLVYPPDNPPDEMLQNYPDIDPSQLLGPNGQLPDGVDPAMFEGGNNSLSESDLKYLENENKTSLPEDDVNQVLYLEYGNYTTQVFHYENAQDLGRGRKIDFCYDDYLRCITSITLPNPVCAWHNGVKVKGVWLRPSYCDVYFENCKIGWRHWRVIGYGYCWFKPKEPERAVGIEEYRRTNNWVSRYYQ